MCPPPCGPRRSYNRTSARVSLPPIKTRISKKAVEEVLTNEVYDCLYRKDSTGKTEQYDGCLNNLLIILHDSATKVKVAGRRSSYFTERKRTIIMDAPGFATILVRAEKEE